MRHRRGPDLPLYTCLAGIFVLGVYMGPFFDLAEGAARALATVP